MGSATRPARRLGISQHTVKFHVESLFRKLGAVTRADAVRKGLRQRLFEISTGIPNSRREAAFRLAAATNSGVGKGRPAGEADMNAQTVTLFRGPERPSSADTNTGAGR